MEMSTTLESLIENKQFCICCVEQRIEGLTEFDNVKRKKWHTNGNLPNKKTKQKKLDSATIKCQLTRS